MVSENEYTNESKTNDICDSLPTECSKIRLATKKDKYQRYLPEGKHLVNNE